MQKTPRYAGFFFALNSAETGADPYGQSDLLRGVTTPAVSDVPLFLNSGDSFGSGVTKGKIPQKTVPQDRASEDRPTVKRR